MCWGLKGTRRRGGGGDSLQERGGPAFPTSGLGLCPLSSFSHPHLHLDFSTSLCSLRLSTWGLFLQGGAAQSRRWGWRVGSGNPPLLSLNKAAWAWLVILKEDTYQGSSGPWILVPPTSRKGSKGQRRHPFCWRMSLCVLSMMV